MGDAIRLAGFYLSEASRLASAAMVSAEIDRAEKLRLWLPESWPHPEIVKSEVVQNGPSALRETKSTGQALDVLATHGWLEKLPERTVVREKAGTAAWRIVKR